MNQHAVLEGLDVQPQQNMYIHCLDFSSAVLVNILVLVHLVVHLLVVAVVLHVLTMKCNTLFDVRNTRWCKQGKQEQPQTQFNDLGSYRHPY